MGGRFALYSDYPKLSASLKLPLAEPEQPLTPRYNVAPGTFVIAVRNLQDDAPLVMDKL